MKILHLTADWKWTGPAEPMLHAVQGLRERGHQADFAAPTAPDDVPGALIERAQERGIEPAFRLSNRRGFLPWRDFAEVRRLREILIERGYEVVHAHHSRDQILARLAVPGTATKLVMSWHHGDAIPSRFWNRWLLGPASVDGLTVLSSPLSETISHDLRWPLERIGVLPGVVDTERFSPRPQVEALRKEFGFPDDARILGVIARLQPHRRFDLLLEAFRRAQAKSPNLRLLVIGRGTRAKQVLEDPLRKLGLEQVVVRAGYRRGDYLDVLGLLDGLVFMVPGSDGSCRAVMEAMSMARPVIATQRGVLPDMIRDGVSGRVLAEEPEAFADAFHDFSEQTERWRAMGQAARDSMLKRHTLACHAERLERFYAALGAGGAS